MSNIDTAKALLKKGIALGDQELIDMANSMLEDTNPVSELWFCEKCNDTFDNTKGRKSCPKCKGRKISVCQPLEPPVEIAQPEPQVNKDDISNFQIKRASQTDSQGRRLRYNALGEVDGTYGKTAPIQVGNSVTKEELSKITEGLDIDSKIKYNNIVVPSRPPVKLTQLICSLCGDKCSVPTRHIGVYYSKNYFICNKCGAKGK